MYEATQSLTEAQRFQIADELQRLFILQDRPFSKEKSADFIEELDKSGIPAGALISGIRGMMHEDYAHIKLPNILAAARSKMTYESSEVTACEHCDKRGVVLMRDAKDYEFSFACICGNSSRYKGLQRWNGENTQYHCDQIFTNRFAA